MALDDSYVLPASAVISSAAANLDIGSHLDFTLVSAIGRLSERSKKKLKQFENQGRCKVSFLDVKLDRFRHCPLPLDCYREENYFRFLAPELLPGLEKCLYLDCDLIVRGDLSALFAIDLGDNYIGACVDSRGNQVAERAAALGLLANEPYVNSGVLLINLTLWREENITEKLFALCQKLGPRVLWVDQDVINVCFSTRKLTLNLRFNCLLSFVPREELGALIRSAIVLHYSPFRPWVQFRRSQVGFLWFFYAFRGPLKLEATFALFRATCSLGYGLWSSIRRLAFRRNVGEKTIPIVLAPRLLIKKGQYASKRCFIIGNAPSVLKLDLSRLNAEFTFGCNKGFYLQNHGLKHLTGYMLSDPIAYDDYGGEVDLSFANHFLITSDIDWRAEVSRLSVFSRYDSTPCRELHNGFFQFDVSKPLARTYSVVQNILQIAVYLGFNDIYFIGVDNDWASSDGSHFYSPSDKELVYEEQYGRRPVELIEQGYVKALQILSRRNVRLYNASVGGKLEAIPRVCYDSLF